MSEAMKLKESLIAKRKRTNFVALILSMSAMTIGMVFLLWI